MSAFLPALMPAVWIAKELGMEGQAAVVLVYKLTGRWWKARIGSSKSRGNTPMLQVRLACWGWLHLAGGVSACVWAWLKNLGPGSCLIGQEIGAWRPCLSFHTITKPASKHTAEPRTRGILCTASSSAPALRPCLFFLCGFCPAGAKEGLSGLAAQCGEPHLAEAPVLASMPSSSRA
jgi:hypothetical protein